MANASEVSGKSREQLVKRLDEDVQRLTRERDELKFDLAKSEELNQLLKRFVSIMLADKLGTMSIRE